MAEFLMVAGITFTAAITFMAVALFVIEKFLEK